MATTDDYAQLPDAELARRMRDGNDRRAEAQLLDRYADLIARVVLGEARRLRMPPSLWDDALQEGLFSALREAVEAYKPPAAARPGGDHFAWFLGRVVSACMRDLARRLRRDQSHYRRAMHRRAGGGDSAPELVVVGEDPALLAQRHELVERLQRALADLDPAARELVEGRAAGQSLHAAAERVGLRYRRARRLWQRAVAVLRHDLRDLVE